MANTRNPDKAFGNSEVQSSLYIADTDFETFKSSSCMNVVTSSRVDI